MITRRSRKYHTRFDTRWFEIHETRNDYYFSGKHEVFIEFDVIMIIEDKYAKITKEIWCAPVESGIDDPERHKKAMDRFHELVRAYEARDSFPSGRKEEYLTGVALGGKPIVWETVTGPEEMIHHQHLKLRKETGGTMGFITNFHRFVSRKEAADIAKARGQIRKDLRDGEHQMMEKFGLDSYYVWK